MQRTGTADDSEDTMTELPDDWFVEHDGQRLVLDPEKVRAAFDHNERTIRACNQKISELELWNKDYRERIAALTRRS